MTQGLITYAAGLVRSSGAVQHGAMCDRCTPTTPDVSDGAA